MSAVQPITQKLIDLVQANGWQDEFQQAISKAASYNVPALEGIDTLDAYLAYVNDMAT